MLAALSLTAQAGARKCSYFGITVFNAKAGKNANAPANAWQLPGKRYGLLYSTVTL